MIFFDRRGLTLPETLLSMVIFSYFTITMFAGTSALNKINASDTTRSELMNKARIVMEKIVWGAGLTGSSERDGLCEADSYSVLVAGKTLHYWLPDGAQRMVVQSQDELTFHKANQKTTIYDPNGEGNPPEPQKYSTDLKFTEVAAGVIQVDLVLGKRHNGRWHYASLSTTVALRN